MTALALAFVIGLSLGLLGGGGSSLTTPVLVYALGVEPRQAIAESLLIVAFTSFVAMLGHARAGHVRGRIALVFGGAGMAGAALGGLLAGLLTPRVQLTLLSGMMFTAAGVMLHGRHVEVPLPHLPALNLPSGGGAPPGPVPGMIRLAGVGLALGLLLGVVGAGGGFAIVPALTLFAGLPMSSAVGTSLAIMTMQCLAGFAGHAAHVQVDLARVAGMSTAAALGSLLGGRLTARIPPDGLRRGFAVLILAMAAFVLYQQL